MLEDEVGDLLVEVRVLLEEDAHVLAALDMGQPFLQLSVSLAIDDRHHPLALHIDDHRNKRSMRSFPSEKVLVDADDLRPRVLTRPKT